MKLLFETTCSANKGKHGADAPRVASVMNSEIESKQGEGMKRYEVVFYRSASEYVEYDLIARAVVPAERSLEARDQAYELLKEKYPEVEKEKYISFTSKGAMVPKMASELPIEIQA